jgi:hypothetical protein
MKVNKINDISVLDAVEKIPECTAQLQAEADTHHPVVCLKTTIVPNDAERDHERHYSENSAELGKEPKRGACIHPMGNVKKPGELRDWCPGLSQMKVSDNQTLGPLVEN